MIKVIKCKKRLIFINIILGLLIFIIGSVYIIQQFCDSQSGEKNDSHPVKLYEMFIPLDETSKESKYKVFVKNISEEKYFIRIQIKTSMTTSEEKNWIKNNINKGWEMKKDGFIYYSKPLLPGEKTTIALKDVLVDNKLNIVDSDNIVYVKVLEYKKAGVYFRDY